MQPPPKLSSWDVVYALNMAIACGISYWLTTYVLSSVVGRDDDLLGGMWAAAATIFAFRFSREESLSAGIARLIATGVSFALCLAYLWFFPFTVVGLAALIGIGTLITMLAGRREDIVTTGITTTVVMVVAALNPANAWQEPLLRVADTVVGVSIGVGFKWAASLLYLRMVGQPVR